MPRWEKVATVLLVIACTVLALILMDVAFNGGHTTREVLGE